MNHELVHVADCPTEGSVEFLPENKVVLSLVLPVAHIRSLMHGGEQRFLQVTHSEVVRLLALIFANPDTTDADRSSIKQLLAVALESPNSTSPERVFIKSVLKEHSNAS